MQKRAFLSARLRRANSVTGYADDLVILTQQIKRFRRCFAQADDALGWKHRSYNVPDPRQCINPENPMEILH